MRIPFRQGISTHPTSAGLQDFLSINTVGGNFVDLNAENGVTEIAFAHKNTNYFYAEAGSTVKAWTFTSLTDQWLYWDINLSTGIRTFGITFLEPTTLPASPSSPAEDQHWFDTATTTMFVYVSGTWVEKARVFAAKFDGLITFTSMSAPINSQPFAGPQSGALNGSNLVGRIVFDDTGMVIIKETGELFTTEDSFYAAGSQVNAVRLESNVHQAKAAEVIAAHQVIKYNASGELELALYVDIGNEVLGLVVEDLAPGEVGSVILQGSIKNPEWNWSTIGARLWVHGIIPGVLTATDPATTPNQIPIARVVSQNEIIFEQGLGGVGPTGPQGVQGEAGRDSDGASDRNCDGGTATSVYLVTQVVDGGDANG